MYSRPCWNGGWVQRGGVPVHGPAGWVHMHARPLFVHSRDVSRLRKRSWMCGDWPCTPHFHIPKALLWLDLANNK
jgi:hypothetical protein